MVLTEGVGDDSDIVTEEEYAVYSVLQFIRILTSIQRVAVLYSSLTTGKKQVAIRYRSLDRTGEPYVAFLMAEVADSTD